MGRTVKLEDASSWDRSLIAGLRHLAVGQKDFWSFRGEAKRDHGHGLMQYPAMMVPQMVKVLLREIRAAYPRMQRVADPFVGSGTVLTEAMLQGLDFIGCDINPLAVLLCRTKSGPFFIDALDERATEAVKSAERDRGSKVAINFPGRDKWFTENVQIELSRIRRAIEHESSPWARRFLWIALAETIRRTSNSRTSTFKLHIRSTEERRSRRPKPLAVFRRIVSRNLQRFKSLADDLAANAFTNKGRYQRLIDVGLQDTRKFVVDAERQADLVITSPPYGDNATTVPYGQYSYLPLKWINLSDIDPDIKTDALDTTHGIDHRSLGGSKRIKPDDRVSLLDQSKILKGFVEDLKTEPKDRETRVIAFVRDLNACLDRISSLVRQDGIMVWTLGNRRIANRLVPLDRILVQLLSHRGMMHVASLKRNIPTKRMASRNSVADTMSAETILIVRKAASNGKGD